MAQASTTTTATSNNTAAPAGSNGKRETKVLTSVKAISKISEILSKLSLAERKRVLAFVNADVSLVGDEGSNSE